MQIMWMFYATENDIAWTKMSRLATEMGVDYVRNC